MKIIYNMYDNDEVPELKRQKVIAISSELRKYLQQAESKLEGILDEIVEEQECSQKNDDTIKEREKNK